MAGFRGRFPIARDRRLPAAPLFRAPRPRTKHPRQARGLGMTPGKQGVKNTPAGERRRHRRYQVSLEVHWKLIHRNRVLAAGAGWTSDISRRGVRFQAGPQIAEGKRLDLSISWPVLLHGVAPVRLAVSGRVIRRDGRFAVVRIGRYEFRTASRRAEAGGECSGGEQARSGSLADSPAPLRKAAGGSD